MIPSIVIPFLFVSPIALTLVIYLLKKYHDSNVNFLISDDEERVISGKIAIITGANSGIGLAVAQQLLSRGAEVVLACRDADKTQDAIANLYFQGRARGSLHFIELDLTSLQSIRQFAIQFRAQFRHVDLLINNAGIMAHPPQLSHDGLELHFAVNHFGHVHLTNLLLSHLSPHARIINLTSGYYRKAASNQFDDLVRRDVRPERNTLLAYARSKLANCLHVVYLNRRLIDSECMVFAVRPGFIRGTRLGRHFSPTALLLAYPLIWFFSKNIHQGIQTILHCILADDQVLTSGKLYYNCKMEEYSDLVNDDAADQLQMSCESLIDEIEAETGQ